MKFSDKRFWFIGIVLVVILALTLLAAPGNPRISGSTYSRAPDGYGAWYAYMQQQGTPIQRWQKRTRELPGRNDSNVITLLQVNSSLDRPRFDDNWVAQGNTLIILGVQTPVTEANFRTTQDSPTGNVRIATRRRLKQLQDGQQMQLGDRFGAVVWQETIGKGKVILASTPHLAANAYQDSPGNFKFLAQLVTQNQQPIWVDEYLHGYREQQEIQQETAGSWLVYFAKTPLLPIVVQGIVLLLILVWAQNRRFGQPQTVHPPVEDNSAAYIQALASVLHKAESSEFVTEVIGNEEKRQLQNALGLGGQPVEYETLRNAWVEQTGRSPIEIDEVFHPKQRTRRLNDRDLLSWLEKLQTLRSHLPS
jgi:hypothetical protein